MFINTTYFPHTMYVHAHNIEQAKAWCKQHIPDADDSRINSDRWQWDCTHDMTVVINNNYYRAHQFGFKDQEKATWFKLIFALT